MQFANRICLVLVVVFVAGSIGCATQTGPNGTTPTGQSHGTGLNWKCIGGGAVGGAGVGFAVTGEPIGAAIGSAVGAVGGGLTCKALAKRREPTQAGGTYDGNVHKAVNENQAIVRGVDHCGMVAARGMYFGLTTQDEARQEYKQCTGRLPQW